MCLENSSCIVTKTDKGPLSEPIIFPSIKEGMEFIATAGKTDLSAQIQYIEKVNKVFLTPIGVAIKSSLLELQGIKKKNIPQ